MEFHGYGERKLGSPNAIIKLAYQAGMIDDELLWSEALKSRNDVVHSYSDEIALRIIKDSQEKFLPMFSLDVDEIENVPTLLMFDVVDLDSECNKDLLASIRRDGVVLYEV